MTQQTLYIKNNRDNLRPSLMLSSFCMDLCLFLADHLKQSQTILVHSGIWVIWNWASAPSVRASLFPTQTYPLSMVIPRPYLRLGEYILGCQYPFLLECLLENSAWFLVSKLPLLELIPSLELPSPASQVTILLLSNKCGFFPSFFSFNRRGGRYALVSHFWKWNSP